MSFLTTEETNWMTALNSKEKTVILEKGEKLKSTGSFMTTINEDVMEIEVVMFHSSSSDNYTEAYNKRINYHVKNDQTGQIITQGTLYYSKPTDYLKKRVAYTKQIDSMHLYQPLRLYLESPTGLGSAMGGVTIRP